MKGLHDLLTGITTTEKAGTSNGKFLGYLANGETPAQLRKRWSAGEFPDLNTAWAKVWIKST